MKHVEILRWQVDYVTLGKKDACIERWNPFRHDDSMLLCFC